MMGKISRKWIPVSFYDIAAMESWLTDLAAKGYYLKNFGTFFAHFVKGEAREVKYRLEPAGDATQAPTAEMLDYYQQSGWCYVACLNRLFYIYRADNRDTPEIHTDAVVQGYTFDLLGKKLKLLMIASIILLLLMIGMILSIYIFNEHLLIMMVDGQFINQAALLLVYFYLLMQSVTSYNAIRRLIAQLKAGVPLSHSKNYKRRKRDILVCCLVIIAAAATIIHPMVMMTKAWDQALSATQMPLPTVRLADMEEDAGFQYADEAEFRGRIYENYVRYQWSVIAPIQYEIGQNGTIASRHWADDSGIYNPSMVTTYYQLSVAALAKPLLADLADKYTEDSYDDHMIVTELQDTAFDRAILAQDGETQCLFASLDNQVIYVRYYGYADLASYADQFAAEMVKVSRLP